MELTRQAWGFIRRHRRSIMVGVGVGVVGYAAWKAKKLLDEYKRMIQELDLARFEQHRLQMHMLRSRSECVPALLNFMQTLRKRVNESVDITPLVKRLKAERDTLSAEEKQELWKQIMVSGFTRFFLAYYGFNLLNVMLRVQVHILGRYAFETSKREAQALSEASGLSGKVLAEEEEGKEREKQSLGRDERHRLLSLVYEYFLGGGLRQLKELIERVVLEELGGWSVHDKVRVSYNELHDALTTIRRRLEGPRGMTTGNLPLLAYVVDVDAKSEELQGTLSEMANETWDAIESPSFKLAVEDCLDATFRVFLEDLHGTLYAGGQPQPQPGLSRVRLQSQESGDDDQPEAAALEDTDIVSEPALAKVIAHMKSAASKICGQDPQTNDFIRVTADNRSVNLLCSSFFASGQFA